MTEIVQIALPIMVIAMADGITGTIMLMAVSSEGIKEAEDGIRGATKSS